jgi:hypothetical protein
MHDPERIGIPEVRNVIVLIEQFAPIAEGDPAQDEHCQCQERQHGRPQPSVAD